MNDKDQPAEEATIYSETPGTPENAGLQGQTLPPERAVEAAAEEQVATDKATAAEDTLKKEDTSGEAG